MFKINFCWELFLIICCYLSITNNADSATNKDFRRFELTLCGNIILPTDIEYTEANKNSWSFTNNIKSKAIIYIKCIEDISKTISFLKKYNTKLPFRIRSGGNHQGGWNKCNECVIIDLSNLKEIKYILKSNNNIIITVESGVTIHDFIHSLEHNNDYNVTIPHGLCPKVAFGGYGQGGGYSLIMREYGLNIDYIIGIDVVLANGKLVYISDENQKYKDLFWAIKGASGGNFGVVTKYYYKTIKMPKYVLGIDIKYAITDDKYSIKYPMLLFRNYYNPINNPSNKLTTYLFLQAETDMKLFPYGYSWRFRCLFLQAETDSEYNFDNEINIIKNKLFHLKDGINLDYVLEESMIKVMTYCNYYKNYAFEPFLYKQLDMIVNSRFAKTCEDFNDNIINTMTDIFYEDIVVNKLLWTKQIGPFVAIESLLGEINNDKKKNFIDDSFYYRDAWMIMMLNTMYMDESKINDAYIKEEKYNDKILNSLGNIKYINYQDGFVTDLRDYYGNENVLRKLKKIKTKYDKYNLFQYPMSIPVDDIITNKEEI
eukprot:99273_1